jgi:hypothetical protein
MHSCLCICFCLLLCGFLKKTKDQKFKVSKHPSNLPSFSLSLKPVFLSFSFQPAMLNMMPALFPFPRPTYPSPPLSFPFFSSTTTCRQPNPAWSKQPPAGPPLSPSLTHRHLGPTCHPFPIPLVVPNLPPPPWPVALPLLPSLPRSSPPSTELAINAPVRTCPTAPSSYVTAAPPAPIHRAIMAVGHRAPHHHLIGPPPLPSRPYKRRTPSPLPICTSSRSLSCTQHTPYSKTEHHRSSEHRSP